VSPGDPPLARLFAIAYRSLVDGLHERLRARGWLDVRPAFGFVLLAARDAPTTSTDIAALTGVTKQAASKLIETMEDAGYLRRVAHGDDARQRPVALTARGHDLLGTVEDIYRELEQEWVDALGADRLEGIRTSLVAVLSQADGGRLPPVRPSW
jgi:DNA-binding MarR family transcriptional regulator